MVLGKNLKKGELVILRNDTAQNLENKYLEPIL